VFVDFEAYQRKFLHFGTYLCVRSVDMGFEAVTEMNVKSSVFLG
jgi:hypothetical protein